MPATEHLTIGVHIGAELPEVGKPMYLKSELYDDVYWAVTPKKILGLRWGKDGVLVVDIQASRKQVDRSQIEESEVVIT